MSAVSTVSLLEKTPAEDPTTPTLVGDYVQDDADGGYVFQHNDWLFQGESNFSAIYDFSDPSSPTEWGRIELEGDLDTLTPIGNVAIASVDKGANPGEATAVVPWQMAPDAVGPSLGLSSPVDGETWVETTSRIGLSFDEMIEPRSVFAGSLRVWTTEGEKVPGRFYTQENIVNFVPDSALLDETTYVVQVPEGGMSDTTGNPTDQTWEFRFSTGGELVEE